MKREKIKVAYTCFSGFIAELGYKRDPMSNRLQKT
jgi:hypothetical protein